GQDIAATVNGVAAAGKGKIITVNNDALDVEIELNTAAATAVSSFTAMSITGGGAKFNLGPSIDIGNQVSLGIGNVSARFLGSADDSDGTRRHLDALSNGGAANVVDGDLELAQKVVGKAIDEVASLRGRIGAFQKNVV